MRKVLITGGGGFIGRHLARALAETNEIVGLGRGEPPPDWPVGAEWIRHDLTDFKLPATMPARIDAVVHLAQSRKFRNYLDDALEVMDVNTRSTLLLLLWARAAGAQKFVFSSTGGIYGMSDEPFTEEHPYVGGGQLSLYFASKYSSELVLQAFAPVVPSVILRPFFVFGPGQDPTMLMPRLTARVRRGEAIQLQGRDGMQFNPIYIADCVRAFGAAIGLTGSHTVNLAGPEVVSLRRVGEIIGACLGRAPVFAIHEQAKPGHVIGNTARMRALLGAPTIGVKAGLDVLCQQPSSLRQA